MWFWSLTPRRISQLASRLGSVSNRQSRNKTIPASRNMLRFCKSVSSELNGVKKPMPRASCDVWVTAAATTTVQVDRRTNISTQDAQRANKTRRMGGLEITIKNNLWHFFTSNKAKEAQAARARLPFVHLLLLNGRPIDRLDGWMDGIHIASLYSLKWT